VLAENQGRWGARNVPKNGLQVKKRGSTAREHNLLGTNDDLQHWRGQSAWLRRRLPSGRQRLYHGIRQPQPALRGDAEVSGGPAPGNTRSQGAVMDRDLASSSRLDPAIVLQRKADRLSSLIVASDYPDVDIDVEIAALRRWCRTHLPDRLELFELVYVSRFTRLREQFRS
jgi:hypothetical protein